MEKNKTNPGQLIRLSANWSELDKDIKNMLTMQCSDKQWPSSN